MSEVININSTPESPRVITEDEVIVGGLYSREDLNDVITEQCFNFVCQLRDEVTGAHKHFVPDIVWDKFKDSIMDNNELANAYTSIFHQTAIEFANANTN